MAKEKELKRKRDCILLNKMYVGTYLSSKNNNIGHEVINLIRTDDGENYIAAMPYSTIANDKIGRVKYVLLVRPHTEKLMEILAKAEIETEIIDKDENFDYKFQENYITGKDGDKTHKRVVYGGHYLHEIYTKNNNYGNGKGSLITFKAKENGLKRVKENTRLFITTNKNKDENTFYIGNINFPKQEHKAYFSPNADITSIARKNQKEYKNAYEVLNNLINDKNLWEIENTTKRISDEYIKELLKNEEDSMIDILDKKDAENTYSNFFYHIFDSDHELFKEFAKDVLKIEDMSANFTIAREEGNKDTGRIDLLIYDDKHVIVIENKIKSGIHGKEYDLNGKEITNQLKKYYDYVTKQPNFNGKDKKEKIKEWDNKFGNKEHKFYIFAPNYNKIEAEGINGKNKERIKIKDIDEYYEIIRYDRIFNFFSERKSLIPYYKEFLYALKKHSNNTDNHYETEILKRFVKVIRMMNEEKNIVLN